MEIKKEKQYNQGIGKYKVLSSNAGVGSIIATKWGGFIMPLSSSEWASVKNISNYLDNHEDEVLNLSKISSERGVELLEDSRFMSFLRSTEGLTKLRCFIAVPHVSLDQYNQSNVKDLPLNKRYKENTGSEQDLDEKLVTIPAVVFPRWFYSTRPSHELKTYEEWQQLWRSKNCNNGDEKYFAPPRDPDKKTNRKLPDFEIPQARDRFIHALLEQVSMVLICPNGHISDIPWDKFFCASVNLRDKVKEEGFDLFGYDRIKWPCPANMKPDLQWMENRSHAESFGRLQCRNRAERCSNCPGSVSLEGIMNLQPLCPGERPWEGIGSKDSKACMNEAETGRSTMKWALVTSNSVYYAESFSSLYIPETYKTEDGLPIKFQQLLKLMSETWYGNTYLRRHPDASKEDYITAKGLEGLMDQASDNREYEDITEDEMQLVINEFLHPMVKDDKDVRENYRFQEFSVFNGNSTSIPESNDKLSFCDIELPDSLRPYLNKIQQVETLGVTSTQINFSRVSMPQPRNINGHIEYPNRMKIFKESPEDVLVMPANQIFGEGLFFSFNDEAVNSWLAFNNNILKSRYSADPNHEKFYDNLYQKMQHGGFAKFYLLHTFSHMILKELEFSCGYPTASLKERLYFSERMCGVLIYTADGAEGSMGGLVWQGQPQLIERIILSALHRALNCSSDPICWENEDQFNYAACFSCAMVSETSCEERNIGLDRRALVDEQFGYFKDILLSACHCG
jgi:hypothetical protein